MAEFQEVMKQAKRMCEAIGDTCLGCPVYGGDTCVFMKSPCSLTEKKIAETEKIVKDWAAKHPEPRYPSWKEWQDTNFPNNDALMRPCIFESEEYFNCKSEIGCEKCINKPIPADIAEKLGIKPIGGVSDEKA